MPTPKQINEFILINNGYKTPPIQSQKPTHGNLWLNGELFQHNKPFALLQHKRKELLKAGHLKREIKITYTNLTACNL